MRKLEAQGRLDRALEGLPSDEALAERRKAGRGLTRPEAAVVLANAKMAIYDGSARDRAAGPTLPGRADPQILPAPATAAVRPRDRAPPPAPRAGRHLARQQPRQSRPRRLRLGARGRDRGAARRGGARLRHHPRRVRPAAALRRHRGPAGGRAGRDADPPPARRPRAAGARLALVPGPRQAPLRIGEEVGRFAPGVARVTAALELAAGAGPGRGAGAGDGGLHGRRGAARPRPDRRRPSPPPGRLRHRRGRRGRSDRGRRGQAARRGARPLRDRRPAPARLARRCDRPGAEAQRLGPAGAWPSSTTSWPAACGRSPGGRWRRGPPGPKGATHCPRSRPGRERRCGGSSAIVRFSGS